MNRTIKTTIIKIGACFLILCFNFFVGPNLFVSVASKYYEYNYDSGYASLIANSYTSSVVMICTLLLYTKNKK